MLAGRGGWLLGDELGSGWRALWTAHGAFLSARAEAGWPLETRALAWPLGGPFASPSPLFDALSVPLRFALGPVSTFDALAILHLGLAVAGAWVLARQAGLRQAGALVAATGFGFNALLLTAGAASGAPEVLGMAWVPWMLAAALWLFRAPGPVPALAAALGLVAVATADLHLALFAPLLAPLVLLPALAERLSSSSWRARASLVGWGAVGVGAGVAAAVWLLRPMLAALADPDALTPPGSLRLAPLPAPDALGAHVASFATLSGILLPGDPVREQGAAVALQSTYAGWVLLLLALTGATLGRLRWAALAVVAALLAMGPYLLVTLDGWRPTPVSWWRWLREAWPATQMVSEPVRAMAFSFAGLAVLAGAGAEKLATALSRGASDGGGRLGRVLPWALSAAMLVELLLVSPVPAPLPAASVWIPGAVTSLRELPDQGAVLDWPQKEPGGTTEISRYVYYQLWHGRPVFTDLQSGAGPTGVESNPFIAALERVTYGDDYRSAAWTAASRLSATEGIETLAAMGYRWLVLHPWHVAPDRQGEVAEWLNEALELERAEPDGSRVYAVRPLGARPR